MNDKNLPSVDYLRKRLRYDPETGKLFWRDCDEMSKRWRDRYAETEAFTCVGSHGYLTGKVNGRGFKAHRIAYAVYHGNWPNGQIDHINGMARDNRIANLRDVDQSTNQRNQWMRADNTSGVTGVRWFKPRKKWLAQASFNGRNRHIGLFDKFEDAVAARKAVSDAHGFSKRHGQRIDTKQR